MTVHLTVNDTLGWTERRAAAIVNMRVWSALPDAPFPNHDGRGGLCLQAVRGSLQLPGGIDDAISAWKITHAADRHASSRFPYGVPVYLDIGTHGHIMLADYEPGHVWTTDFDRRGFISREKLADIVAHWRPRRMLGWAETLNGYRLISHEI